MSKSRRPSSSFFPPHVKSFFARRVFDATALTLMAFAAFWVVSIVSYSPADLSGNAAASDSSADIANWGGARGAYIADIMVQSLGYVSLLLGLTLGVSAYRLLKRHNAALPLSIRIGAALMGVIFMAVATAALPRGGADQVLYWGGAIGHSILNMLIGLLPPSFSGLSVIVTAFISFICGSLCFAASLGLSRAFWIETALRVYDLGKWAALYTIYKAQSLYAWLRHYDELDWDKPAPKAPKMPSKKASAAPRTNQEPQDMPAAPAQEREYSTAEIVTPVPAVQNTSSKPPAKNDKQRRISFDELGEWQFPPSDMLQEAKPEDLELRLDEKALQRNADMLQQVLNDFGVDGEIVKIRPGPVVTLYELEPAPGVKSSKVIGLSDDIARSMSALSVRAAVVPGRSVIGIEIPNQKRQIVYLRSLIESREYDKTKAALPLILGKDIGGEAIIADLAKMPHLLIAGTTGSGKSVAVNTMILSLLYRLSPDQCRMIMIDPKMLELSIYDDIPHLLSPVVTDPGRAVVALKWAVQEMENRYRAMSKFGVRNISGYNAKIRDTIAKGETLTRKVQTGYDPESGKPVFEDEHIELVELPYIVIVVDEFADLMLVAGKDVESAIQRLAQMARAAGIHLVMATQRPSVDVITGVIKANFPTRISFQVTSKFDSRTILGDGGAEQLLGMGDMLYMASGGRIQRVHGPFVDDKEVEEVVNFVKEQGEPEYLSDVTDGEGSGLPGLFDSEGGEGGGSDVDDMYDEAVALIAREQKASTSFIQRHLQIGYNRAARIIEEMEKQGVVGPANHVGKREILVSDHSDESATG